MEEGRASVANAGARGRQGRILSESGSPVETGDLGSPCSKYGSSFYSEPPVGTWECDSNIPRSSDFLREARSPEFL